jgi:hypothetical protein
VSHIKNLRKNQTIKCTHNTKTANGEATDPKEKKKIFTLSDFLFQRNHELFPVLLIILIENCKKYPKRLYLEFSLSWVV